jgi:acyl carrier protein
MTIEEQVITAVKERFNVDVVGLKTKFVEDLGADSLDIMELAMSLDEQYDINIPDNDLREFKTVSDVIYYIREKTTPEVKKVSTKK